VDDVEALLADLARWSADTRVDDAARSRMQERWLRRQAAEEARFAGVALDLAERKAVVAVRTTTGRTLHGRIVAVARDFCMLRQEGGMATFVTFPAIAALRPHPGQAAPEAASERTAPLAAGLAEVLAGLAGDRPRVRIGLEGGGEAVNGELRAVGADVVTVRLDGEPGAMAYVQLASVRELTLMG
jgi:hypothetical protein